MAIHSSVLAWRIPRTEEPGPQGRKKSDTTEHTWIRGNSMLNFFRNCQNCLAVYILTSDVRGFLCVPILANTCRFLFRFDHVLFSLLEPSQWA